MHHLVSYHGISGISFKGFYCVRERSDRGGGEEILIIGIFGVSPYVAYMYMPLRSLHAYSVRGAVCTVTLFGQETRQFMSETLSQLGPFSRRTVTEDLLNSVNTFTLYCDLITIELKEVQ